MTMATEGVHIEQIEDLPIGLRNGSPLLRPVEMVASALLVTIIGLLLAGVISRYVFSLPVVWIDEVASLCFLWLAMLGSVDRARPQRAP